MNEKVNKCLLAHDKIMHEMHLLQPRFTYSGCGPFAKKKKRVQKFKELGDSRYIYKNKLDKDCFQHAAYGDFKDLAKTASDKISCNKAFNIAKNPEHDGYQRDLASLVYNFFDKKSVKGSGVAMLANESAIKNQIKQKNCTNQLPENVEKEKYIHHLKPKFGVLQTKQNMGR